MTAFHPILSLFSHAVWSVIFPFSVCHRIHDGGSVRTQITQLSTAVTKSYITHSCSVKLVNTDGGAGCLGMPTAYTVLNI